MTTTNDTVLFLEQLLNIPSPTFKEADITLFLSDYLKKNIPNATFIVENDAIICTNNQHKTNLPHIGFVGHTDVVPDFFKASIQKDRIYGAGSSDMKAGLACFIIFLVNHWNDLVKKYNVSLIIYPREEGTPLEDNGLNFIINQFPNSVNNIDLAFVGEPTNNTIQLGCTGSLHCKVTIPGQACHSARPWQGENALYKAIPLIEGISKINPTKHTLFGVDFFDVITITESQTDPGRTTIPGEWACNINYRFAPVHQEEDAKQTIHNVLKKLNIDSNWYQITDCVPAGNVIDTPLFKDLVHHIDVDIEAKQAWTDVAQLTALGVPAINFGPGLPEQAHKPNEYALISLIKEYMTHLEKLLTFKGESI
ncbi:succinyl-diaminopimelate desuccinylase [Candidatus Marinamargulisbacteria bacterium SCGC AG-410-N11]|nr:succinyl-diaminopimelate desuccinylase [Candidatus Marinamargulisbacteria bacterium SCGC AG-410-N11]